MVTTKEEGWQSASDSKHLDTKELGRVYKEERTTDWESHPLNGNVKLAYLLTRKNDGVKVTCLLARIPKGESIPEHTHAVHDILFPLSGMGKIWINGLGDLQLKPGVLVNVPPDTAHKVYDVTEDLVIYDVFSDAIL